MDKISIILDCGATHSSMAVWQNEKRLEFREDLPGINADISNLEVIKNQLVPELKRLSMYSDALWIFGVAGLDDENEVKELDGWFRALFLEQQISYGSLVVISDIELVLRAGNDNGIGIAIISGTGSNCFARNPSGAIMKVGGVSHLLSDEGSGFSIGWKGLHVATKMMDGRLPKSLLAENILKHFEVLTLVELKNKLLASKEQKRAIASCARIVIEEAADGDAEAILIVTEEINELIEMVRTVNEGFEGEKVLPVYLSGSLFKNDWYRGIFVDKLKQYSPEQTAVPVEVLGRQIIFSQ